LPTTKPALARTEIAETPEKREERKHRTRVHLMQAALLLIGEGRGFTSLSLREITRAAGVVPAAFYRHFRDMDELGLALVEEGGMTLRRLLRDVRRERIAPKTMLESSVALYLRYVREQRLMFAFIAGERGGGSPVIRNAIRREEAHFAAEMAQDLAMLRTLPDLAMATLQMICGLIVATMLNAASDILDLPSEQPLRETELTRNFVRQLRVIFLGARQWRD
jgi:TetR/AcrR family transcriptional regulator, fatty acid biosynthesis regulator